VGGVGGVVAPPKSGDLDDSSDYHEENEDCDSDEAGGSGHMDDHSVCSNGEVSLYTMRG